MHPFFNSNPLVSTGWQRSRIPVNIHQSNIRRFQQLSVGTFFVAFSLVSFSYLIQDSTFNRRYHRVVAKSAPQLYLTYVPGDLSTRFQCLNLCIDISIYTWPPNALISLVYTTQTSSHYNLIRCLSGMVLSNLQPQVIWSPLTNFL